jgi:hypothetical protein
VLNACLLLMRNNAAAAGFSRAGRNFQEVRLGLGAFFALHTIHAPLAGWCARRGISDILSARADQKGKGLFEVRQASTRE